MLSIKVFIKVSLTSLNVRLDPLEGASLRLAPCGAPHPPLHHDFHEHCDQVRKHIVLLLRAMAKISFNIILLNLAVRIIGIFLLIDLFVFSS